MYSADSGNREGEEGGKSSTLFLLYLARQISIQNTLDRQNNVNTYISSIGNQDFKSYFEKDTLTPEECNLEKIKAQKFVLIEDALKVYRTNLVLVCNASKRDYFKLVEEVSGLSKSGSPVMANILHHQQLGNFSRQFSKTLLTPKAYTV